MAISSAAARTAPVRAPRPGVRPAARPRLAVVARPAPRSSIMPFALLCTAIVVLTLASVLFLNIRMSDMSFQITRLQGQSQDLREAQQALQEREDQLSTPQELEARAQALGMAPTGAPIYIDLSTGTVLGEASAAAPLPAAAPAAIPQAQIYQQDQQYHGMGNERD